MTVPPFARVPGRIQCEGSGIGPKPDSAVCALHGLNPWGALFLNRRGRR